MDEEIGTLIIGVVLMLTGLLAIVFAKWLCKRPDPKKPLKWWECKGSDCLSLTRLFGISTIVIGSFIIDSAYPQFYDFLYGLFK